MITLIHCHHCQEDMNTADWEANGERCLHCDTALTNMWEQPDRKLSPLVNLRNRLRIREQLNLRSKPAYV